MQLSVRTLKRRLDATVGIEGDYSDGTNAKEQIKAIPRLPGIDNQSLDPGALLTAERLDWVFTADDLVLNGLRVEPVEGHWWRYKRSDGYFAYYDVLPDETGRCFERSDHYGILIRVHTKLDRVEPAPQ